MRMMLLQMEYVMFLVVQLLIQVHIESQVERPGFDLKFV